MFSLALNTTDTDSTPTGLKDIRFQITPSLTKPSEYTLTLRGFLSPGWTGRLTAGLAKHRIGIVTGEAEKISPYAWQATFLLKAAPFSGDPLAIDYVALAATEPTHQALAPIVLREYRMEPCHKNQGSLYLEIRGEDRLGFLGDLLDFFSMRCLFPVKMQVETVGSTALDKFWLRGVGGAVPSDSVAHAIRENLDRLVVTAPSSF